MEAGEMIVVGARPSVGKTGFVTGVIDFLASVQEKKCLFFSAEMPKDQIARRFAAARADVDLQKIRRGQLTREEVTRLSRAVSDLASLADRIIIVDTPNIPLARLRSIAFEHACEVGLDFIGIDYAQLIVPPDMGRNANRTQQVGAISRGVKGMARELKVPVMMLAQLNRGAEGEGRTPKMSDLRESGDLEQDADGVILLHREAVSHRGEADWEQNNPTKVYEADIIVAKQRNGQAGAVKVAFHGPTATYMDLNTYQNRYIYGVA
jgi:replicative DNA helicase